MSEGEQGAGPGQAGRAPAVHHAGKQREVVSSERSREIERARTSPGSLAASISTAV